MSDKQPSALPIIESLARACADEGAEVRPLPAPCPHARTTVSARTWIRTCLDCGAWKNDDECDDMPLGGWRERDGWRRI